MNRLPPPLARSAWIAAVALALLAGCAVAPRTDALSSQRIAEIVASPDRSAADRQNDLRRKPVELLGFMGLRPGAVALDVSAGGGYTTELLARALGPTGAVYGQSQPRDPNRPVAPPVAPEGNSHPAAAPASPMAAAPATSPATPLASPAAPPRTSAMALAERSRALRAAGVAAAPITPVERRFDDPVPPALARAQLDLVTLMFNYHDLGHMGVDRAAMNRALFAALKPGGRYIVADHAGRPGTGIGEAGTLHRVEEAYLRRELEAAGFRLLAEGGFLRNPADPRDRNTPEPPMPKDEFVLMFVKP